MTISIRLFYKIIVNVFGQMKEKIRTRRDEGFIPLGMGWVRKRVIFSMTANEHATFV